MGIQSQICLTFYQRIFFIYLSLNMIEILWFRLLNPAAVASYCWGASTHRTGQRLPRKCATFNYRVDMDSLFTVPYDRSSTPLLTKRRSMHTLGRQAAKHNAIFVNNQFIVSIEQFGLWRNRSISDTLWIR